MKKNFHETLLLGNTSVKIVLLNNTTDGNTSSGYHPVRLGTDQDSLVFELLLILAVRNALYSQIHPFPSDLQSKLSLLPEQKKWSIHPRELKLFIGEIKTKPGISLNYI